MTTHIDVREYELEKPRRIFDDRGVMVGAVARIHHPGCARGGPGFSVCFAPDYSVAPDLGDCLRLCAHHGEFSLLGPRYAVFFDRTQSTLVRMVLDNSKHREFTDNLHDHLQRLMRQLLATSDADDPQPDHMPMSMIRSWRRCVQRNNLTRHHAKHAVLPALIRKDTVIKRFVGVGKEPTILPTTSHTLRNICIAANYVIPKVEMLNAVWLDGDIYIQAALSELLLVGKHVRPEYFPPLRSVVEMESLSEWRHGGNVRSKTRFRFETPLRPFRVKVSEERHGGQQALLLVCMDPAGAHAATLAQLLAMERTMIEFMAKERLLGDWTGPSPIREFGEEERAKAQPVEVDDHYDPRHDDYEGGDTPFHFAPNMPRYVPCKYEVNDVQSMRAPDPGTKREIVIRCTPETRIERVDDEGGVVYAQARDIQQDSEIMLAVSIDIFLYTYIAERVLIVNENIRACERADRACRWGAESAPAAVRLTLSVVLNRALSSPAVARRVAPSLCAHH